MKLKIFDVVELKDGNKATILENGRNTYKAEIANNNGVRQEIRTINEIDINKVIISK